MTINKQATINSRAQPSLTKSSSLYFEKAQVKSLFQSSFAFFPMQRVFSYIMELNNGNYFLQVSYFKKPKFISETIPDVLKLRLARQSGVRKAFELM